jgi:hypothetical protein
VAIPSSLLPDVRWHLQEFVGEDATQLPESVDARAEVRMRLGRALSRSPPYGQHVDGAVGRDVVGLMARMGHASTRAAQIYLHTTSTRDRAVTDAMNQVIEAGKGRHEGTGGVLTRWPLRSTCP